MLRITAAMLAALLSTQLLLTAAGAHAQAAEPFPIVPPEPKSEGHHVWAYASLASGATLVGLSFMFSNRADQAYQDYLDSSDPDQIESLYDRAVSALGHESVTDMIVLIGYYTAVSLTMNFYAVPAGSPGLSR